MPEDFVSEADLSDLALTPVEIRAHCPWATELTALDGSRCWAVLDLASLLGGRS